ncbi:MAG: YgaP family membrane protein [Burkholderiaceae bacterium]|jgi:hypothetical protein|nr:DUF2892 domain-containing protein [Burkholderiaceae bacterium]MBU6292720.1 DUF2892 domain-containing protein [Burkholderiales bacterium]NCV84919.1 DUF2892 domain-containing protein [Oxalobacteraceae bacterium]
MMKNVGETDRALRVFVGVLLILLSLLNVIGPWGWLGLLPIATGLLRVCPAYSVLGLRSCPVQQSTDNA